MVDMALYKMIKWKFDRTQYKPVINYMMARIPVVVKECNKDRHFNETLNEYIDKITTFKNVELVRKMIN